MITSSGAGAGAERGLGSAIATLRSHTSVEIAAVSSAGDLDGALHLAGSRRIVIAGNDRTLHAVVSALYRRHELAGKILGLLPVGGGNGFARRHGIPDDIDRAAQLIAAGAPRPVDLVVDELGGVVVDSVHIGAPQGQPPAAAGWLGRIGSWGIGPVTVGDLARPVGSMINTISPSYLRLRIELDGQVVVDVDEPVQRITLDTRPCASCAEPTNGGPASVEPNHGEPCRAGHLSLTIDRAAHWYAGNPLTWAGAVADKALRRGHHDGPDGPDGQPERSLRGHSVRVSGQEFWCHPDGEVYGPERQRTWRVEPALYGLLLPALARA